MKRTEAWVLLTKYNQDHFHLQHALTVEAVMRWYAEKLGYGGEADFWATVGWILSSSRNSTASNRRS